MRTRIWLNLKVWIGFRDVFWIILVPAVKELRTSILVVGGGLGGVAAALAALAIGVDVVLTEELDWLGGQLTCQGVPLDEHPWIESFGGSTSYAEFRRRVRDFYRGNYPLSPEARRTCHLNPGMGNVGSLCHEPSVAVQVIDAMLAPYESCRRLRVLRRLRPIRADTSLDRVTAIAFEDLDTGSEMAISADIVIDATETGDLLDLARVEHVFGAEGRARTGEPNALDVEDPFEQQAITWCFALDFMVGENHRIEKPAGYERWGSIRIPSWPGPQFNWTVSDHVTHEPRQRALFVGDSDEEHLLDLWHARRIAYRRNFAAGAYASDITVANWPQMDYWDKPLIGVSAEERAAALAEARDLSLSWLYWMQTDAPRHDGGVGYPELRLRPDVLGTRDGLAKQAYYREGRRIEAELTVLEQHIGVAARPGATAAEPFADSVGIGAYRIDLHPSTRGRNTVDIDSFPFQIPLGALLPVRVENLLPACKNLGTTRITSGAYRVHPVEWSIGEASGALATYALRHGVAPRAVRADADRMSAFQDVLRGVGVQLAWPTYGALTPTSRTGYLRATAR